MQKKRLQNYYFLLCLDLVSSRDFSLVTGPTVYRVQASLQAYVAVPPRSYYWKHRCGATIVAADAAVTAAHCCVGERARKKIVSAHLIFPPRLICLSGSRPLRAASPGGRCDRPADPRAGAGAAGVERLLRQVRPALRRQDARLRPVPAHAGGNRSSIATAVTVVFICSCLIRCRPPSTCQAASPAPARWQPARPPRAQCARSLGGETLR